MSYFGFYNINKPPGPTSHDIVAQVRSSLGRKVKVGHAGTLDPFASGVLVVAVGPATRLTHYVQASRKCYTAEVTLGACSTTDDIAGDITPTSAVAQPTGEQIRRTLARFVGEIMQEPPAYSAVHIDGERAYGLARRGKSVRAPARAVRVYRLDLLGYEYPRVELDVQCGAGVYIRSLARDIGASLGVGGYCSRLIRRAVGPFTIDRAVEVEMFDAEGDLIPPVSAVARMAVFEVPASLTAPLVQGKTLDVAALRHVARPADAVELDEPAGGTGEVALVDVAGGLLAIGELRAHGRKVHPQKVFVQP